MQNRKDDCISSNNDNKTLGKNYFFNVAYQILCIIVPLITAPYLARVLTANGTGQYSFSNSLCSYLVLLASLGFGYYAQRTIAAHKNDKKQQTLIFWEIILVRFVSTGLALGLNLLLYYLGVYQSYSQLMLWWSLNIVATGFDISFLFQGNEKFGSIVLRNSVVKIASVLCIFLFVKNENHVWIYVLCIAGSTLAANLSLWISLPKFLVSVKFSDLHPARHIIPTLRLFVPTIALSIYLVLDKTLIGLLIPDTYVVEEIQQINGVDTVVSVTKKYSDLENGYYEQAEKIVKTAMTIITSLTTVMLPRNSNEHAAGNKNGLINNIYLGTKYVLVLGIPMTLGIIAVAPNLIPWFLGDGYEKCIFLMQLFAPLCLVIGLSNVLGIQYLVATRQDTKYTIVTITGALINLTLNLCLIPFLWSYGAVIATLVAESSICIILLIMTRHDISGKKILLQSIKPLISGSLMFALVYFTQLYLSPSWYFTLLLVFEGAGVYLASMLILKDPFIFEVLRLFKRNKLDQ